eukprot:265897_1
MSHRRDPMDIPQQGNNDNNEQAKSDKKKLKNKTESDTQYVAMDSLVEDDDQVSLESIQRERSYSAGSMADGNRRLNEETATSTQDADFFRFPEPKTLLFKATNIGLYSPLVSTRQTRNVPTTIYHGVPSYLNPNLMRQRHSKRSTSLNTIPSDDATHKDTVIRAQSHELHTASSDEQTNNNIADYEMNEIHHTNPTQPLQSNLLGHQQRIKDNSPDYYELDDKSPSRGTLPKQWSLYNEAKHKSEGKHAVSYVKTASQKRLLDDFSTIWKRAYFALIILAMFNGLLTFAVSKAASKVWELEVYINEYEMFQVAASAPAYILLIILKVLLVVGAIWLTRNFAPGCAGSGVPELRAILSGIWIRHYLSKTTYIIKTFALTLVVSSGIPIGLEGPFIHLSSIMARQLTKLKLFAHLDRKQMLSAACAGGLASVFGAPIGGVLFSIEVTSTYYPVTNYWTAFCCAMVGSTMTHIFQSLSPTSLMLYETNFTQKDQPLPREFIYCAGLGTLCGIMSVIFINVHDSYVELRRKYQSKFFGDNAYGIAIAVVVLFTTILFFIGDFAIEPARKAVSDMFNVEYLNECDDASHCYYHDWVTNGGIYWNLSIFYVLNYLFTICSVTLSVPCGIFSPVFTLGSVLGRIYGEILRKYRPIYCDPRVYSVVGAASMAAGVTQTISPAVIALEITQDLSLAVPCLLAVIVSAGISSSLCHSFYDSVLQLRGIPMLPIRPTVAYKRMMVKPQEMYRLLIADDVMNKEFSFVTIDPSSDELVDILSNNYDQEWFPIVHTQAEAVLVGEVRRSVLMDLLQAIDTAKYMKDIPEPLRMNHISFYDQSVTESNANRAQTFKDKLANWRSKTTLLGSNRDRAQSARAMVELPNEDRNKEKVKTTLMTSGFIERINLSPIQVISEMPLTKIYTLFHILKPQNVYVTKYSRLIGVINEVQLLQREFETQHGHKARMIRLKCNKLCTKCKRTVCCCC